MEKIKSIIIDDELRARRLLANILTAYCPEVEVVAQCENVPDGVMQINKHQPAVVFLDIEMPDYSGFELLEFFRTVDFHIIFVTAYNKYAVKAFEVSAVDYLLKPVQIELLERSVEKLKKRLSVDLTREKIDVLKDNLKSGQINKIAIPVSDGYVFSPVSEITHFIADGAYTHIHFVDGSSQIVSKKLKYFEDILIATTNFFRVHRSYMINTSYLKKYSRHESLVELENGVSVHVARSNKVAFEEIVSNHLG